MKSPTRIQKKFFTLFKIDDPEKPKHSATSV